MDADDYITLHESFFLSCWMGGEGSGYSGSACVRTSSAAVSEGTACESHFCMTHPSGFLVSGLRSSSRVMLSFRVASEEWSPKQLPSNAKSTKRPSAWAEMHEEEDEPSSSKVHRHHALTCPVPDMMHDSRLALQLVVTIRHAARPLSHRDRPSSKSVPLSWDRRHHPSLR